MNKLEDFKIRISQLILLADQALATKWVADFNTFVSHESFASFRSASLSFLINLYGKEHPIYKDFDLKCEQVYYAHVEAGKGILLSVKQEIENGWLFTVKGLIAAELFSDFLEMAKYLLDEKFKDPAAVMIGSVLEEHLRQMCLKNNISIEVIKDSKTVPKKADTLNSELASNAIYNKLEQKNVTAWLDLRNKAAHGRYSEYTVTQVELMYQGVLDFLLRNNL